MQKYCIEKQEDGYAYAQAHSQTYGSTPHFADIIEDGADTWLKPHEYQYEMLAYTMEQEGKAYLDVMYDIQEGKYSQDQMTICSDQWLRRRDPQWEMVGYGLANDF